MIQKVFDDCKKLSIEEMRVYILEQISQYLVGEYKEMSVETKHFMYKLYSFLYFCNELNNKEKVLACMQQMLDAKKFKDRNEILKNAK